MHTKFTEYLNESEQKDYLSWKRKNVTLRGMTDIYGENDGMAKYGSGLYTAFLGNKEMAKEYGKVYFLVNAKPKNPKTVLSTNDAEIYLQEMVTKFCKEHNVPRNNSFFSKNTTIAKEMLKLGYDGFVIKGREMVNYAPPENVLYFENENQLYQYYQSHILNESVNDTVNDTVKLNDNFWKWFGKSKVVDKNGDPMYVYHTTNSKIEKFRKGVKGGLGGNGIYFSEYPLPQFGRIQMKVYLKIESPITKDTELEGMREINSSGMPTRFIQNIFEKFPQFDGIINRSEIVVKNPNQIKSFDNDGTWDIDDKNIYS